MKINGETKLTGVMGWPVAHSFSPPMHNAAFEAAGLNWVYVPLPVPPAGVGHALRSLPALGFCGVNVTVPHKQAVIPFLDIVSPAAAAIGAVNTIKVDRESGRLSGFNTDWRGFLADLAAQGVKVKERDCLVLGAGGSARAVVYGLNQAGGVVTLLARRVEQAQQLVAELGDLSGLEYHPLGLVDSVAAQMEAPLIINTTPLGMVPNVDSSLWPDNVPFPRSSFVYDLVYNPQETRLMHQAAASGCRTSNGLGMLLQQGAAAFTLWTGVQPDLAVMEASLPAAKE